MSTHGKTWLPNMDYIKPGNTWATIKSTCILSDDQDTYNVMIIKNNMVFARGNLMKMNSFTTISAKLKAVKYALTKVVRSVRTNDKVKLECSSLRSVVSIVLWMFANSGSQKDVSKYEMNAIIAQLGEDTLAKNIEISLPAINTRADSGHKDTVRYIMEAAGLVFLEVNVYGKVIKEDSNVIVVGESNKCMLSYTSSPCTDNVSTYGIFYKKPRNINTDIHEKMCNVLVYRDGIWDNKGRANCWIISNSWNCITEDICLSDTL